MLDYELTDKADLTKKISITSLYPWLVWVLVASFFFYKYVIQVSPSVMSTDLMRAFGVSGAGLGNLAACFFYAYLIMQIPVGLLLDKWSPRLITTGAIFICALGTLFFSHAHSIWVASFSRALMGLGAAFAAVSCFKLASIWFPPKRFAFIAGLSMTAAMLGAVWGQAPLSYLVESFGWRIAMRDIALPGFLLMLLVLIFVRDKTAENIADSSQSTVIDFKAIAKQLLIILKNSQTWLLSIYSGLAFAPISVFGGLWGVSFLEQSHQLTATGAASAISWIFIGFAIGCPIAGWFSDYINKRKMIMLWGTLIAVISLSCILYFPNLSIKNIDCLMLVFGLSASCFFLCFTMIREIHPLAFAATVLGFMNTFDSICEALTEPLVGKLLDMGWNGQLSQGARIFSNYDYHMALLVLPIYFIIALILLFFIKESV